MLFVQLNVEKRVDVCIVNAYRTRFTSDREFPPSTGRKKNLNSLSLSLSLSPIRGAHATFRCRVSSTRVGFNTSFCVFFPFFRFVEGSSQYLGFSAFATMATISFALYTRTYCSLYINAFALLLMCCLARYQRAPGPMVCCKPNCRNPEDKWNCRTMKIYVEVYSLRELQSADGRQS